MTVKVVLVTGAARRIGAEIVRELHQAGLNMIIHYHRSEADARFLRDTLEAIRPGSAKLVQLNLLEVGQMPIFAEQVLQCYGRLDVLVNNASTFYPTIQATEQQWEDLIGVNVKAPYFMSQAFAAALSKTQGSIIHICDVNAFKAKPHYDVYCVAKAALAALTKQQAKQWAPLIRVNAVAPGLTLPPEGAATVDPEEYQDMLAHIPLKKSATPADIARAVRFLALEAGHITGQILAVDGGGSFS